MIPIKLGTDIYTGKPRYYYSRNMGINMIAAMSRWGKTVQMMNMLSQLSQYKQLLIIDFMSGEYERLKYGNKKSDTPMSLPDLQTITPRMIGLDINTISISDLGSLGLSRVSAENIYYIIKKVQDFGELYKISKGFPTSEQSLVRFNNKHPEYRFETFLHTSVAQKFQNFCYIAKEHNFFLKQNDARMQASPELWDYLLENNLNIHLSLDLSQFDTGFIQFYVGKILDQMVEVLPKHDVVLCVDEADIVFPKQPTGMDAFNYPLSLKAGQKFVYKLQRKGFEMWVATQSPHLMLQDFWDGSLNRILGRVESIQRTHHLKFKYPFYREFIHETVGEYNRSIFIPDPPYNRLN